MPESTSSREGTSERSRSARASRSMDESTASSEGIATDSSAAASAFCGGRAPAAGPAWAAAFRPCGALLRAAISCWLSPRGSGASAGAPTGLARTFLLMTVLIQPSSGPLPVSRRKCRRSPTRPSSSTVEPVARREAACGEDISRPCLTSTPPFSAPPTISQTRAAPAGGGSPAPVGGSSCCSCCRSGRLAGAGSGSPPPSPGPGGHGAEAQTQSSCTCPWSAA
mmetsp:Transcript_74648/g.231750  ORF Transcript_74648/g.231750 Transcript_74648/m.231750 type:complete len:224 (+) Transcript_74648:314-985(+)